MSYAFVFRAYPDVDHMAPLAWRLLEAGERVHGIVSPGYDPRRDYRLEFLERYPRFHLHEVAPAHVRGSRLAQRSGAARRGIRRTLPWALAFIIRHRVRVVAVEWGYGLGAGYENLRSPSGVLAVLRSFAGSLRRWRDPQLVRMEFLVAARLLGRTTVCLPHGLSVKLGRGSANGELVTGELDWRDRNRFTAYVLNTEHHREWFLERAAGDPKVMQTWGSLRWAPEWFELNRRLAPPFSWPSNGAGRARLKVIYMVPKWANHVDKEAALELVKRLQGLDEISLAIKGHPRPKSGSADPLRADPEIDWRRIHDLTAIDSVAAIGAADVIIDVGSSIGIEVLMQGKVLVNPAYIHDFYTLFDDVPDSCIVARDANEVVAYLRQHAAGDPQPAGEAAYREILRRGVFGSRAQPYDVIGTYCERVRALAGEQTMTRS